MPKLEDHCKGYCLMALRKKLILCTEILPSTIEEGRERSGSEWWGTARKTGKTSRDTKWEQLEKECMSSRTEQDGSSQGIISVHSLGGQGRRGKVEKMAWVPSLDRWMCGGDATKTKRIVFKCIWDLSPCRICFPERSLSYLGGIIVWSKCVMNS